MTEVDLGAAGNADTRAAHTAVNVNPLAVQPVDPMKKPGGESSGAGAAESKPAPPTAAEQEPGWMRNLYLSSQNRLVQCLLGVLAPVLPWLPIILRGAQVFFSLVTFSVMASGKHPASCVGLPSPLSPTFCWTSRNYADFTAFHFLVVVAAIVFVWSALILSIDLIGAFRMGNLVGGSAQTFMPTVAFSGDAALSFLAFGAACAASGLRTGLGDMSTNYCDMVGSEWCSKIVASTVFMFFTWLALVPSAVLNTSNAAGPW